MSRPLLAALSLFLLAGAVDAQEAPRSPEEEVRLRAFMLNRDRDREGELARAEELLAGGQAAAAALVLERLLQSSSPEAVVPVDADRCEGLLARVRATLAGLPEAQARQLAEAVRAQAEPLLARAVAARDEELLAVVARRFPGTPFAGEALLTLADLALATGRAEEAGAWFHRRLAMAPGDRLAAAGLAVSRAVRGVPPGSLPADAAARLGGREVAGRELAAWLAGVAPCLRPTLPWPAMGGLGRAMAPPPPRLALAWEQPLAGAPSLSPPFPCHAVADGFRAFLATGREALAIDLFTGTPLWTFAAPRRPGSITGRRNRSFMAAGDEESDAPGLVLAGALAGRLFFCPLEVTRQGVDAQFRSIQISSSLPLRRLFALDAATGRQAWSHAEGGAEGAHNAAAPPLALGDRVWVPTVEYGQTVSSFVCCFAAGSGRLLWRTRICSGQLRLNMFGNVTQEYSASPLALAEGVLYGGTNLGAVFALAADTGELIWLGFYNPNRPRDMAWQDHFAGGAEFASSLANNPPLVREEEVVFAPLDGDEVFALARRDGRLAWRLRAAPTAGGRRVELLHLLGERQGRLFFQGRAVVAVDPLRRRGLTLDPRAVQLVVPPERLGLERGGADGFPLGRIPRGGLGPSAIYTLDQISGLGIWNLDGTQAPVMAAIPDAGRGFRGREAGRVGNLLMAPGGILLAAGRNQLTAFLSQDHLVTGIEEALAAGRAELPQVLTLATVLLKRGRPGDLDRAQELLERAGSGRGELAERARELLRRALLTRAELLAARGGWPEAEAALRRAASLSPPGQPEWEARRLLAQNLKSQGRLESWAQELEALVDRYGREVFPGPDGQPAREGPRLLVELARGLAGEPSGAPAALRAWRRLLAEFDGEAVAGEEAWRLAAREIAALIEAHGPRLYAPVEKEAEAWLARIEAGGDPEELRRLARLYPNSQAAQRAFQKLAEQAAEKGDLASLVRGLGDFPGPRSPLLLRRLALAAERAGNPWLAQGLLERLAARHGGEASTHAGDAGRTYAEVARLGPRPAPPTEGQLGALPARIQRFQPEIPGGRGFRMLRPLRWGIPEAETPPILVAARQLLMGLRLQEGVLGTAWSVELPVLVRESLPAFLCGPRLVLAGDQGLIVVEAATGSLLKTFPFPPDTHLRRVVARHGLVVALLESTSRVPGPVRIQVVEPWTGTLWGEVAVPPPQGSELLLVAGPESLHLLFSWEEGRRGESRIQVETLDPVLLEVIPGPRLDRLELASEPSFLRFQATADHLLLPLLGGGGELLRAFPLRPGAAAWELGLPPGEEIDRVTVSAGRIVLLTYRGRQGILRLAHPATGAEVRNLALGPQPELPSANGDRDPWACPGPTWILALSGSSPRARTLHGLDLESGEAWVLSLPGSLFQSTLLVPAPVFGPGIAALALPLISPAGQKLEPEVFLVDLRRGQLLDRFHRQVGVEGVAEIAAPTPGMLVVACGSTVGILTPEGEETR